MATIVNLRIVIRDRTWAGSVSPRGSGWVNHSDSKSTAVSDTHQRPTRYRVVVLTASNRNHYLPRKAHIIGKKHRQTISASISYANIVVEEALASKVSDRAWRRSVPPRGSGWVDDQHVTMANDFGSVSLTHSLPRGGTTSKNVSSF